MIGDLPKGLEVNGTWYEIRSDFRMVLRIIQAMNDPDLEDGDKVYVCLYVLYEDFPEEMPQEDYEEAFKQAMGFIDHGISDDVKNSKKLVDFEQDENLLFPAINNVAGKEVREEEYVHWWTFLGYFMSMGECTYSTVLTIRSKKAEGKRLETWEQEFYNKNKSICVIKDRLSEEEKEKRDKINAMLG